MLGLRAAHPTLLLLLWGQVLAACSLEPTQVNTKISVTNRAEVTELGLDYAWVDSAGVTGEYQVGLPRQRLQTDETVSFVLESAQGAVVQVRIEALTAGVRRTFTFDPKGLSRDPYGELAFVYAFDPAIDDYGCDFTYQ